MRTFMNCSTTGFATEPRIATTAWTNTTAPASVNVIRRDSFSKSSYFILEIQKYKSRFRGLNDTRNKGKSGIKNG